jgi:transglutaminase-like putative cysteine protease
LTAYRFRHTTIYEYGEPVVTSHNELHLMPRGGTRQQVQRVELRIDPNPDTVKWHKDYFGNDVVFFSLEEPHERLAIRTDGVVALAAGAAFEAARSRPWEDVALQVRRGRDAESLQAYEHVFASPFVPIGAELAEFAHPSFPTGRPVAEGVLDLSHRIHGEFRYEPDATDLDTALTEVLRERRGVCQDFAHVMIGALRSLGLPARYVSGYLRTRRDDAGEAGRQPERAAPAPSATGRSAPDAGAVELVGFEASHAWVAAWCPTLGWFEVDPTNDLVPADRHVVLAWGRDYDDVSPVKGVTLGGGRHSVKVAVEVVPVPAPAA